MQKPDTSNAPTLPGIEPDIADDLQRKGDAPLTPAKPQQACDLGLFGDGAAQLDLVDRMQQPKPTPPSSTTKPKSHKPSVARKNGGFILSAEQHEEVGHRFKAWDQKRSESHYRLARIIRERLGMVTVH
jgi:hypothetical protein